MLKLDGLLLSKKYIHSFSLDIIYREFIYLTFNYLFTKLLNSLCHFWNHLFLCIFLAQILHTLDKSSSSKCKFSHFPLLALKFTKFLKSFFKQKVSFSSKFGSFFSVMTHKSSVLFLTQNNILSKKLAHQSKNCQTCHCWH